MHNDTTLGLLAERVIVEQNNQLGNREAAIDPATVILMIQIIGEIVRQIRECRNQQSGLETVKNPSWVEKLLLRRKLVQDLGRQEFRSRGGNELVQSMLIVGSELNEQEFNELWNEVES